MDEQQVIKTARSVKRWVVFSTLLVITVLVVSTVIAIQIPKDDVRPSFFDKVASAMKGVFADDTPSEQEDSPVAEVDYIADDSASNPDKLPDGSAQLSTCDNIESFLSETSSRETFSEKTEIGDLSARIEICRAELTESVQQGSSCEQGQASDLNGDGFVDSSDLRILLIFWGTSGPGDIDSDGNVGTVDLLLLLENWGNVPVCTESYKFEKPGNKLNLGETLGSVQGQLDDSDLPTVLASNEYFNAQGSGFEYDQEIIMTDAMQLTHFADSDLNPAEIPEIGYHLQNNDVMFTYNVDFIENPESDLIGSDLVDFRFTSIEMLGETYLITDATHIFNTTSFDLVPALDAVELSENQSTVIEIDGATLDVSVAAFDDDSVVFIVNGVFQDQVGEHEVIELDGIGIDNIYFAVFDIITGEPGAVEFIVSDRLITIEDGDEVKVDGEDISFTSPTTLYSSITSSGLDPVSIEEISLNWVADTEVFLTDNMPLEFPGIEILRFYQNGFTVPAEEQTVLRNGVQDTTMELQTPVTDGLVNFNLVFKDAYNASPILGIGKDANERLVTSTNNTLLFDTVTDRWFVTTWIHGDEHESYVWEVESIGSDLNETIVILESAAGATQVELEVGETHARGEVQITLVSANEASGSAFFHVEPVSDSGAISLHDIVTAEGLRIPLPVDCLQNECPDMGGLLPGIDTNYTQWFIEESEDEDISLGEDFYIQVGQLPFDPQELGITSFDPELNFLENSDFDDDATAYVVSPLATKVDAEFFGDTQATLTYHGSESFGNTYLIAFSTACSNGLDDDFDGLTDFPEDSDCDSFDDESELLEDSPDLWTRDVDVFAYASNVTGLYEVEINAEIRNIGTTTAPNSFTEFAVSGQGAELISTPQVLPTQEIDLPYYINLPNGTYTATVTADHGNEIPESNEGNNGHTVEFNVP